VTKSSLLLLIS